MLLRSSQSLKSLTSPLTTVGNTSRIAIAKCLSTASPSESNPFNFNEQETNLILATINTKSAENLARYDISKAKLKKLEVWKSKNGGFHSLDDILHLDGFSTKIVDKFCKSLLGEAPAKGQPRKVASFVHPKLPETQIEEITSTVSISVGVSSIIWSRLQLHKDGPCELTHWERHDIQEKKLHLHDLIHRCMYATFLIPQADCYLFENPQIAQSAAPGTAEQVNINVQRAQLTAILGFALANRKISTEQLHSNIFYLRKFLAARLFQHLVGTERVSAEKTILTLMRTYYNVDDIPDAIEEDNVIGAECFSSRGNVSFPSDLRLMYKGAERYHRELLGYTLLLNLAFVRLVILRDSKSIALVSRSSKPNEVE